MESNKEGETDMLPLVRQGVPGTGAGHHSMWETSGRELRGRASVIQQATAQYEHRNLENQEKAVKQCPSLSASLSLARTARRRDCPACIKWSCEKNIEIMHTY